MCLEPPFPIRFKVDWVPPIGWPMASKWSISEPKGATTSTGAEDDPPKKGDGQGARTTAMASPRPAGLTTAGIFGGAVVLLAVLGLILNLTLPWVVESGFAGFEGGQEVETKDRGDIKDDYEQAGSAGFDLDYEHRLLDWPLAAFIVSMVAGLVLVAIDFIPGLWRGAHRAVQSLLLLTLGFFGFLLALTGTRWLGQYFSHLFSDSQQTFHLHAVPYLNFVLGAVILVGAGVLLARPLRDLMSARKQEGLFGTSAVQFSGIAVIMAVAALLLMPLLPLGAEEEVSAGETVTQYIGEDVMALYGELADAFGDDFDTGGRGDVASALGTMRAMIWIVLYGALGVFLVACADRSLGGNTVTSLLMQGFALAIVPIVFGVVFTILYYVRFGGVEDMSVVWWNPFPILAMIGLLAVYGLYVLKVLVPYIRSSPFNLEASSPE